jgi:hypothetical protein
MTAVPILLADAVTAAINTAAGDDYFGIRITARRSYPDWDIEYQDLDGLDTPAVDVVFVSGQASGGDTVDLDSVSSLNYEPSVDICVRKRFKQADREGKTGRLLNQPVDAMVNLVEKMHELMASLRDSQIEIALGQTAEWVNANVRAYVNQRRLREGFFEGVVRVNFSVTREDM